MEDDRLANIRRDVVGAGATFSGPFGEKAMLYADWTASGRALTSIENFVRAEVLPLYANTHTTTSSCGLQSTCFRQEARQLIAQACNARVGYSDKHADVVVFAGSGSTSAINKLVLILGLHLPPRADSDATGQPVVFVGPHEHHSNILPWRESCAMVVQIGEGKDGNICRESLLSALTKFKHHKLKIGSFSAASNVTGVCADVDAVTEMLHKHGALSFWDYAAGAPYLPVDMNPVRFLQDGSVNPFVYKDAVFISPHKLPGGPGAPGVLVAKRNLFANSVPSEPGGGTVFFVTGGDQRYLSNRHEREEGGTQDIVGSIRAGLAFQTKTYVGQKTIEHAERKLCNKVYASLNANHNIAVLGPRGHMKSDDDTNNTNGRLPICSFLVRAPACEPGGPSRWLHHSFVCAVLNDVFGLQVRGGCACAGPYALSLLGLDLKAQAVLEHMLIDQSEVMRPGFTRVSLPYFASDAEVAYTMNAIHAVANHGWRLLTLYRLDVKTGEWRHKSRLRSFPERKWLAHMKLGGESVADAETEKETSLRFEPVSAASEAAREVRLDKQFADGLALLEQCGQVVSSASGKQKDGKQQLRVPAIHELELSNEQEMLSSGTRDEDELGEGRLAYDEAGGESGTGTESKKTTDTQKSGLRITAKTANDARWFVFPSEGASLLRRCLVESTQQGLPLTVLPTPGRVGGVIRPVGFDERKGVADPNAPSPATGLESISFAFSEIETETENVSSFRTVSSKYPLRVTASKFEGVATGGLAQQGSDPKELLEKNINEKTTNVEVTSAVASTDLKVASDLVAEFVEAHIGGDVSEPVSEPAFSEPPSDSRNSEDHDTNELDLSRHARFATPPAKLMRVIGKAVSEWQMIQPGDRVMLGLSGGKDSLAMLHILHALQRRYPPGTFHLAACTIDPGTEAFNPRPLIKYCEKLGVEYYYQEEHIMAMAETHMAGDSICAFCARMKRGALYSTMRRHGYNKLVLAQHLDDVVESFLMSTMHNGLIRTMKAAYVVDEGDLTVIRPAIYARERALRDFSYQAGLPVINENCPACFEQPKERHHIKKLLAREEGIFPSLYSCLRRALTPLLDPCATDLLATIQNSVEKSSKVGRQALRQRLASRKGETCVGVTSDDETDVEVPVTPSVLLLSDASEQDLLRELVRRRHRGRAQTEKTPAVGDSDGANVKDLSIKDTSRGSPTSVVDVSKSLGDRELRRDMDELNKFCTADGCVRVVGGGGSDDDE